MTDLIKKYIDEKNAELYKRLSEKCTINLYKNPLIPDGKNNLWSLNVQQRADKKEFSISYYEDVNSTAPFSHELFHIDIIDKGFSDFSEILPIIKEGKRSLLFIPVIGHICNVCAHLKFYQDFINLGYTPDEFVTDYNADVNTKEIISSIGENFDATSLPNTSIELFIASFFTAKDNKNPANNSEYNQILQYLSNKDSDLFKILDVFWTSWTWTKSLDIKCFIDSLVEQVELWHTYRNVS